MDKLDMIYMISWMIYNVVREKIEKEFLIPADGLCSGRRDQKAIRFDFRMTGSTYSGAISLLFHSASPNWHYVSVYSIETPLNRTGGQFPNPGSTEWKFLVDHDSSTHDAITQFIMRNEEVIKGWDWIDCWKVVNVSEQQLVDMRGLKKRDRPSW